MGTLLKVQMMRSTVHASVSLDYDYKLDGHINRVHTAKTISDSNGHCLPFIENRGFLIMVYLSENSTKYLMKETESSFILSSNASVLIGQNISNTHITDICMFEYRKIM
jgi:hypothetical protein